VVLIRADPRVVATGELIGRDEESEVVDSLLGRSHRGRRRIPPNPGRARHPRIALNTAPETQASEAAKPSRRPSRRSRKNGKLRCHRR